MYISNQKKLVTYVLEKKITRSSIVPAIIWHTENKEDHRLHDRYGGLCRSAFALKYRVYPLIHQVSSKNNLRFRVKLAT